MTSKKISELIYHNGTVGNHDRYDWFTMMKSREDFKTFEKEIKNLDGESLYILLVMFSQVFDSVRCCIQNTMIDKTKSDDPDDMYWMAKIEDRINYYNNMRLQRDVKHTLLKAVELGSKDAALALANQYDYKKDKESRIKWLKKAEEMGNVQAAEELGDEFMCGVTTKGSEEEAIEHYKKAVDLGSGNAAYILAEHYLEKFGREECSIDEDSNRNQFFQQAYDWYRKAYSLGWTDAEDDLYKLDMMRKEELTNDNE